MKTQLKQEIRTITYLNLFNAVLIVIVLVGLAFILQPSDDLDEQLLFGKWFVGISILLTFVLALFRLSLKNKESIWLQPVSKRTAKNLVNVVVVVWLCLVAGTAFMLLKNNKDFFSTVIIVCLAFCLTVIVGYYIQKIIFNNNTLLGYGISSICALVMMILLS